MSKVTFVTFLNYANVSKGVEWALVILISYLIGSIPTGYLVTKVITGKDIRKYGSGNVGGLNTYRVISKEKGKVLGLMTGGLVALFDGAKAILSYFIAQSFAPYVSFVAPMIAIFGHNYPVWLKYKGGRGIAALFGFFLVTLPSLLLVFLLLQGLVYVVTRRFALGAILALLLAIPLHHLFLSVPTYTPHVLAEFPVWLRYREKYEKWQAGELGVNM